MIVRAAISFMVLALLALAGAALVFVPIPADNRDAFTMLLGALTGTGFGGVLGYWVGSSQSSAGKDHTIAALTDKGE